MHTILLDIAFLKLCVDPHFVRISVLDPSEHGSISRDTRIRARIITKQNQTHKLGQISNQNPIDVFAVGASLVANFFAK
jgi:hypothetical protein